VQSLLSDRILDRGQPDDSESHYDVCMQAIQAGKHVHVEKPLSITRGARAGTAGRSSDRGVRVGTAPDTFLGGGLQTCRKLIDDGWIGEPIGATAFMLCHGHESWHPEPEFYYKVGGGQCSTWAYYLTALVALIGPIKRVTGATRITFPERTVTSAAKYGTRIQVDVPTHVGDRGVRNGAIATLVHELRRVGASAAEHRDLRHRRIVACARSQWVWRAGASTPSWSKGVDGDALTHGFAENSRGIGVADMAYAIRSGRAHRASGALGNHVLEAMHGFHDAASDGATIK